MHEEERRHEEGDERGRGGRRVGRYGQMAKGTTGAPCPVGLRRGRSGRPSRAAFTRGLEGEAPIKKPYEDDNDDDEEGDVYMMMSGRVWW